MDAAASFPENWTPPPELAGALPRRKQLSKRGIFSVCFSVVLLLGAVFIYGGFRTLRVEADSDNRRLRAAGVPVTAKIVRVWRTGGKSSRDMVAYVFSASGARVRGDSEAPGRYWSSFRTGSDLPIRYLPSDPSVNHPTAWEEDVMPAWLAIAFPIIPAGMGIFLLLVVRRQGEVAANGVAAAGVVARSYSGKTGWTVIYRFRTRDGVSMGGSDQSNRPLGIGSTVCILYLPQSPQRSSLYPLSLYKVPE